MTVVAIGVAMPIFIVSGLYRAIFRYSGWPALLPTPFPSGKRNKG